MANYRNEKRWTVMPRYRNEARCKLYGDKPTCKNMASFVMLKTGHGRDAHGRQAHVMTEHLCLFSIEILWPDHVFLRRH